MDTFEFVSSMTTALAWPLATIAIVTIFRKGILEQLPDVEDVDAFGFKAKFRRDLKKVLSSVAAAEVSERPAVAIDHVPAPSPQVPHSVDLAPRQLEHTATASTPYAAPAPSAPPTVNEKTEQFLVDKLALRANPSGVVLDAWKELEFEMRESADMERASLRLVIDALLSKQIITNDELEQVQLMYKLRNRAAHSKDQISPDDAEEFKYVASLLALRFNLRRTLSHK